MQFSEKYLPRLPADSLNSLKLEITRHITSICLIQNPNLHPLSAFPALALQPKINFLD